MSHGDVWLELWYDHMDVHILTPKDHGAGGVFPRTIRDFITYEERTRNLPVDARKIGSRTAIKDKRAIFQGSRGVMSGARRDKTCVVHEN